MTERKKIDINILVLLAITIFMCLIAYKDFIFGNQQFVLNHDAYNQFIPELTDFWRSIRENKELPFWSFNKGLGQEAWVNNPEWVGDIFNGLLLFVNKDNIADAFIYLHIIKIIFAAFFFYNYLNLMGISSKNRIFFSIIYAFNGHMIYRGLWLHYATDVALVAFVLWAFELLWSKRNKWVFPISLALLFCARNVAYTYVYTLFLAMYFIFRQGWGAEWNFKEILKKFKTLFIGYLTGICIAAPFIIPGIYYLLSSSRIAGETSNFKLMLFSNPFHITRISSIIQWILRSFSGTITGITAADGSFEVLLELPLNYCSVVSLLLISQIFFLKFENKRQKFSLIFLLGMAVIYNTFEYVRYFFGAFMGAGYKTSGYWTFVFIIISVVWIAETIGKKQAELSKVNIIVLAITSVLYLLMLFLFKSKYSDMIKVLEFKIVCVEIIVWTIILLIVFWNNLKRRSDNNVIAIVSLTVLICEICLNIYLLNESNEVKDFVDNRTINVGEYDDGTYETVQEIKRRDNGFYRVIKQYPLFDEPYKFEINHSQIQDYHGTPFYTSVKSKSLIEFYEFYDLSYNNLLLKAFNDRNYLNSGLAVKYLLAKDINNEVPSNYKYAFTSDAGIVVYENKDSLPLGVLYEHVVKASDVKKMPATYKDSLVFSKGIVEDEIFEKLNDNEIKEHLSPEYSIEGIEVIQDEFPNKFQVRKAGSYSSIEMSVLSERKDAQYEVKLKIDAPQEMQGILYYSDDKNTFSESEAVYFSVDKGIKEYKVSFESPEVIKFIRLDIGRENDIYTLEDICLEIYDTKLLSYNDLVKDIKYQGIENIQENLPNSLEYNTVNTDPMIYLQLENTKYNLAYKISFDIESEVATLGQLYFVNSQKEYINSQYYEVREGTGKYTFNFDSNDIIEEIRIDVGDDLGRYKISKLEILACEIASQEEINFARNLLVSTSMVIHEWGNQKIEGNINANKAGILYLSIPYDKGWKIYIDGEKNNTFVVNGGMTGVHIEEGYHDIRIIYRLPGIYLGVSIFVMAMLYLILTNCKWNFIFKK